MKKKLAWLCLCLLVAPVHANTSGCDDPHPLRFALTPFKNPEALLAQYRPLIQQLEKALDRRVEIISTTSYGTAIEGLLADGVDLAELGPAAYAIAMSRGAKITAFATFSFRQGPHTESASTYRSLLIVRRDKGFDSLKRLRGSTLALTDPASTSGAVLPRRAIGQLTGLPLDSYFKRVIFAGSHDRAIEAVQKRLVDAAFVSSTRLDEALRQGKSQPDDLLVLWRSPPVPYDPFVLRERLCPALANKIKQVFLGDHAALDDMFKELEINGFVASSDERYREIRDLFSTQP
jgi:phosphonate transport system substrate-binding protein